MKQPLSIEERKAQHLPVGYLNTDTDKIMPGDDGMLRRFTCDLPENLDSHGNLLVPNLAGDDTMMIPRSEMRALDSKRRQGRKLWQPIYDQLVVDWYIARDYEKKDMDPLAACLAKRELSWSDAEESEESFAPADTQMPHQTDELIFDPAG